MNLRNLVAKVSRHHSANRFGKVSPTTAEAVSEELLPYLNPISKIEFLTEAIAI
jgi:hypothetical protein